MPVDDGWLMAVAYGAASFVAVGNFGGIFTSSDGSAWTRQPSGSTVDLLDAAYGPQ